MLTNFIIEKEYLSKFIGERVKGSALMSQKQNGIMDKFTNTSMQLLLISLLHYFIYLKMINGNV